MNVFYILVMDKNSDDDDWLVTQRDSDKAKLERLSSQDDILVEPRLPKSEYSGQKLSELTLTNTHTGHMEIGHIYEIHKNS